MKGSRWKRWMVVAAAAVGMNFQLASCTLDEAGLFAGSLDTLGLSELRNQLFDSSPFSQFFDRWDGFGHGGDEGTE